MKGALSAPHPYLIRNLDSGTMRFCRDGNRLSWRGIADDRRNLAASSDLHFTDVEDNSRRTVDSGCRLPGLEIFKIFNPLSEAVVGHLQPKL
jgi:hypothetical protein